MIGDRTNIRRAFISLAGIAVLFAAVAARGQQSAPAQTNSLSAVFPMTSKSPEARRLVEEALILYLDRVEQEQAIEILRKAVQVDPDFAMGHEYLAQISLDSAEQVGEQEKAFATRSHATSSEQLVIEWYQDAADHKLISAITKMNDVLNQYPHDKWVVWMTTWWLQNQSQYERVISIYERSGITDSPGLINNIGYNYAYVRQFDKAFAMMDKYVELLPNDSNPQDSYAEILRLAGRFNQSIEHYRTSLVINPEFYSSQFGIADTYSLMGIRFAPAKNTKSDSRSLRCPSCNRFCGRRGKRLLSSARAIMTAPSMPFRRLRITRTLGTTARRRLTPIGRWPCVSRI